MGSLVKFAGQPYAGNPHVRLEEGAPVGTPWRDTQALPTERGSPGYGPSYSSTRPGPTLHFETERYRGQQVTVVTLAGAGERPRADPREVSRKASSEQEVGDDPRPPARTHQPDHAGGARLASNPR